MILFFYVKRWKYASIFVYLYPLFTQLESHSIMIYFYVFSIIRKIALLSILPIKQSFNFAICMCLCAVVLSRLRMILFMFWLIVCKTSWCVSNIRYLLCSEICHCLFDSFWLVCVVMVDSMCVDFFPFCLLQRVVRSWCSMVKLWTVKSFILKWLVCAECSHPTIFRWLVTLRCSWCMAKFVPCIWAFGCCYCCCVDISSIISRSRSWNI